jgi:sterol desaturase/sphingolipid hydroxylase (fatty acid hydroxylase superfamily)
VSYREVMWRDFGATLVFGMAIAPAALFVNRWFSFQPEFSRDLIGLRLAGRLAIYVVIADFGHYWVHRFLHTRYAWRMHQSHHAPTHMYKLAQ